MSPATQREPMLDRLRRRVEASGWQCLSDTWAGRTARYRFACARGHVFERIAAPLLYRNLHAAECAACEQEDLRGRFLGTVAGRRGEVVGGPFTGLQARYRLRCAAGHEWNAQGRKVMEGHWCPVCAREVTARGGRCLAADYTVGRRSYAFECAQGHRWEAEGHEILRRSWCPVCARSEQNAARLDPQGLGHLRAAAQAKGGQCLTADYRRQAATYRFRCASGHEWQTTGQNVLNGTWCRRCAGEARRSLSLAGVREQGHAAHVGMPPRPRLAGPGVEREARRPLVRGVRHSRPRPREEPLEAPSL